MKTRLLLVSIISAVASSAQAQGDVSGEAVVRAQCAKCHGSGLNGAPKIGDRAAWIPRAKNGIDPLVLAAMRGHGNMPARGGMASLTDAEFRSAVLYMFNAQQPLRK